MEMEKINDNTIRVLLENEDLTERGITVLDCLAIKVKLKASFSVFWMKWIRIMNFATMRQLLFN